MTIEELRTILKFCTETKNEDMNTEKSHIVADAALVEYINDEEVTRLWKSLDRWYA